MLLILKLIRNANLFERTIDFLCSIVFILRCFFSNSECDGAANYEFNDSFGA